MGQADQRRTYLDIVELSVATGLSISTINRLKKQGKIPCYQPGGPRTRVLFPADAIEGRSCIQSSIDVAPPSAEPGDADVPGTDLSRRAPLLSCSSDSSRLPGPLPRWRRHAH